MNSTILLLLCTTALAIGPSAEEKVARWFALQATEWSNVCAQLVLIFADERWLSAARQLAAEVVAHGHCTAMYLWIDNNSSAVCTDQPLCYVDRTTACNDNSRRWGSNRYFQTIGQRVPLLSALLNRLPLDWQRGVALFDADIVLRRNALSRFARSNATLVVQQEWPCITAPAHLCCNGGLYWLRRSSTGRQMAAQTASLMQRLRLPDQDAWQLTVHGRSDVQFLDRHRYANGYTLLHDDSFALAQAHAIHVNWLPNTDTKLAVLRKLRRQPASLVY